MTSQKNDILVSVREKLLVEGINHFAEVPQDLNADFKKQGGWMGTAFGASAGTSALEHGLGAAVPVAVVVGIMGYFGAKAGSKIEKDK